MPTSDDLLRSAGLLPPLDARDCAFCDKRFKPKHSKQFYCSKRCQTQGTAYKRIIEKPVIIERECEWCSKPLSSSNPKAKFCSSGCRLSFFKAKPCFYCGTEADSIDHFIPKAFARRIEDFAQAQKRNLTVPCCRECNSTAGANVFITPRQKRQYILSQYKKRYRKILEAPNWTIDEINQLGITLKSHVKRDQEMKRYMKKRMRRLSR